jgi:hypothetical protein
MSWIDDIGPGEFFKGIADAVKGKDPSAPKSGTTDIGATYAENQAALKKLVAQLKETTKTSKMLTTAFEGGKVAVPDFTENIKELDEAITKATDAGEREVLLARKREFQRGQIEGGLKASAVNLASGFASAAFGLVTAGLDITKGIIEGQDAISAATQASMAAIKAAAKVGATIGDTVSGLSGVAAMIGLVSKRLGPFGLALAAVLEIAGPLIKLSAEKSAELAEKGLAILEAQLKQVRTAFFDLADSGVTFAGGMTQMTQVATKAGMRVEDFAKQVKASEQNLRDMGGGMTLATLRLAGVSGEIRKGNLGRQLQNLGFKIDEQAKIAASAAAQLNASGRLRSMSDSEVASYTVKYAKNLKILQEFAGKDAEKKLEAARKEAMMADIRIKLMRADPTGKAFERFEAVFAQTAPGLQKGLLEQLSIGTIADAATNIAGQANKGVYAAINESIDIIKNGGDDHAIAMVKVNERLGESAKKVGTANEAIATAARFGSNAQVQGAAEIYAGTVDVMRQYKKGAADEIEKNIEAAKNTRDPLTNAVHNLDDAANKIAVGLQTKLLGAITNFADKSRLALDTIAASLAAVDAALKKMGADAAANAKPEPGMSEKVGKVAVGVAGSVAGAALGRGFGMALGTLGGPIGMAVGAAVGGWLGSKAGEWLGKKADNDKPAAPPAPPAATAARNTQTPTVLPAGQVTNTSGKNPVRQFARGGITKTTAIFGEAGPEAAVPLPDGRTIPVTLKGGIDKAALAQASRLIGGPLAGTGLAIDAMSKMYSTMSRLDLKKDLKTVAPTLDPAGMMRDAIPAALHKMFDERMDAFAESNKDLAKDSKTSADDMKSLMSAQLAKQDEMIRALKDNISINQRILAAAS